MGFTWLITARLSTEGAKDVVSNAFWAKTQITRGRATGRFAESRLIRLVSAEDFDAAKLNA
ncbi:MAG: hypothetical protein OES13_08435 [Acidimicrobiia bacterium]|nr:hypothetical protein [Acidimicrobiia bacterium]